jgi:hypothetical protein
MKSKLPWKNPHFEEFHKNRKERGTDGKVRSGRITVKETKDKHHFLQMNYEKL